MFLFNDWWEVGLMFVPGICIISLLVVTIVSVLTYREVRSLVRRSHDDR